MTQKQIEMRLLAENLDNKKNKTCKRNINTSVLLDFIKKYPVIYDVDNPNYGQVDLLKSAWAEISTEMNSKGLF